MSKIEQVIVNGRDFKVIMPDFEKVRNTLKGFRKESNSSSEEPYQILWEVECSEDVDVLRDVSNIENILNQVENDTNILLINITEIRKKKNGGFWKNSGTDVYVAQYMTRHFTEYTNAWSAYVLRLDVIDENTCEFNFRKRTFT